MLLASLEGAGLLTTEAEAQEELQLGDADDGDWMEDDYMGELFGFDAAAAAAEEAVAALMPALGPQPAWQQQVQLQQQAAAVRQQQVRQQAQQRGQQQAGEGGAPASSGDPQPGSDPSVGGGAERTPAADAPGPSRAAAQQAADPPAGRAGAAAGAGAGAGAGADPPAGPYSTRSSDGTSHPSGSGSGPMAGHGGMRLRRGMSPFKFSSLTFHPAQLERAFAMHHSRQQQKNDLLAAFVVLLALLCAAALHMQAQWPAGLAALLLFAPYFFDGRLYQGLREALLGTTQLLFCLFLSSLQPLPPSAALAPPPASGTCPALSGADLGSVSCRPEGLMHGGEAVLAGFGILRFVVHSCGLHYITLSPLLLRLRTNHALPVQFASLCLALFHLPRAYEATLGRVDTVHLMLLGLILVVFSLAALWALWLAELRMRDAWLERRRRRGAATIDNNLEDCTNGCSGGASPASPAMESEPAAATPGEGPSPSTAAVIMAAEGAPAEAGAAG